MAAVPQSQGSKGRTHPLGLCAHIGLENFSPLGNPRPHQVDRMVPEPVKSPRALRFDEMTAQMS